LKLQSSDLTSITYEGIMSTHLLADLVRFLLDDLPNPFYINIDYFLTFYKLGE